MNDNTILFGGADLRDYVDTISNFAGVWAPMTRRYTVDTIPGKRGGSASAGAVFDKYDFSIGCGISQTTETLFNAAMIALGEILQGADGDGLDGLERHLSKTGGGHYTQTASGLFLGFANFTQKESPSAALFDLQFTNLSGAWQDSVSHEWVTP